MVLRSTRSCAPSASSTRTTTLPSSASSVARTWWLSRCNPCRCVSGHTVTAVTMWSRPVVNCSIIFRVCGARMKIFLQKCVGFKIFLYFCSKYRRCVVARVWFNKTIPTNLTLRPEVDGIHRCKDKYFINTNQIFWEEFNEISRFWAFYVVWQRGQVLECGS